MRRYLVCILSLAAVTTAQDKAEHQLVQQIREGYCHVQTYEADDVPISDAKQRSQSAAREAQKRLSEIEHLGAPGRVALLELANTANEQERWCGINYLLALKDDRVILSLRKIAFNGSENDRDRSWAILDIARMKDVKSVRNIVGILEGGNQQLYVSAIQALGQFKDKDGILALRAILVDP